MKMKRTIFFAAMLISAVAVRAQAPLSFGAVNQRAFPHFHQLGDSNSLHKKWFLSKYAGISTGFMAFNGGSGTFLSAPVGLRLYRQLNNNVYAFADVSVAPSLFHFNGAFYQPTVNKNNSFMNASNFGAYSSAQMGLMYINSERTFSISGSIGVGSYYGRSPFYAPVNSPVRNNKLNY